MSELVLVDRRGPVAVVMLNRPQRHNSLVPELLDEMLAGLQAIAGDPQVGAAVLQANGRSFSTGGDLGAFRVHLDDREAYASETVGLLNRVIMALISLPVPVVAAVHGLVTGGSLGLVLGCDVVLVAPEASFTPYYSVVGFSPDGGWTAMLPSIIGPKRASEVLMRNVTISAEQAVAWGLASRVVAAVDIRREALAVAEDLATKKRKSLLHAKRLLSSNAVGVASLLEAERIHFVQQIATEEAMAGIDTFLQERRRAS